MQNVEHWPFDVRLSRTQNAGTEESEESEKHLPPPCCIIIIIILLPGRERERESAGTGILFEEPNPTRQYRNEHNQHQHSLTTTFSARMQGGRGGMRVFLM